MCALGSEQDADSRSRIDVPDKVQGQVVLEEQIRTSLPVYIGCSLLLLALEDGRPRDEPPLESQLVFTVVP